MLQFAVAEQFLHISADQSVKNELKLATTILAREKAAGFTIEFIFHTLYPFFFWVYGPRRKTKEKEAKKKEKRTVKIIYRADRIDTCGQVRELAAGH